MKIMKSFYEYINRPATTVLNEDKLNVVFDKNTKPSGFNDSVQFGKQVQSLVRGRWQNVRPDIVIKTMRMSQFWNDDICAASVKNVKIENDKEQVLAAIQADPSLKVRVHGGNDAFEIDMQFKSKLQKPLMDAFKREGIRSDVKFSHGRMTGTVYGKENAVAAFHLATLINGGKDIPAKVAKSEEQLKQALGDLDSYKAAVKAGNAAEITVGMDGPIDIIAKYLKLLGKDMSGIQLNGNAQLISPDMIWLVDNIAKANDQEKTLDKLIVGKFGIMLRKYVDDVRKVFQKKSTGKEEFPAKNYGEMTYLYAEIQNKSFPAILKYYEKATGLDGQQEIQETPELKSACAQRRMKLFDDAEALGAQVFRSAKWTGAICREFTQLHQFCRGKPKVIKGTNQIDPELNLNDTELAAKYKGDAAAIKRIKEKRDANDGNYIKDGLSKSMDSQPFEAGWCVGGGNVNNFGGSSLEWTWSKAKPFANWNGGYFTARRNGERTSMNVMMNNSTGELFGFNVAGNTANYIRQGVDLGTGWYLGDFNTEINGDGGAHRGDGNVSQRIKNDPSFGEMFWKIIDAQFKEYSTMINGKKHDWKALSDAPLPHKPVNPYEEILKLNTTVNGMVIFEDTKSVSKNIGAIKSGIISEFKLAFENAAHIFSGINLTNVSKIDCTDVKYLTGTFKDAQLSETLDLVNTKNVIDFTSTFESSTGIRYIHNLDTKSAKSIDNMFNNVSTKDDYEMVLPQLDLRKCESMSQAFRDLNITELNLIIDENQKVLRADNIITGCFRLSKVPPMLFDYKTCGGIAVFGADIEQPIDIFQGCTKLQSAADFDGMLKRYTDHYMRQLEKTKDGYAVIRSKRDLLTYMKDITKYNRGFRPMPEMKFTGEVINANVIDMSEITDASGMFTGVKFQHLGKIINTDNIEKADYMFSETNITSTPEMNLPNAKTWYGIFNQCRELRKIMDPPKKNAQGQIERKFYTTFSIDNFQGPIEYKDNSYAYCFPSGMPGILRQEAADVWLKPYFEGLALRKHRAWEKQHITENAGKMLFIGDDVDLINYLKGIREFEKDAVHADTIRFIPGFNDAFQHEDLTIDATIDFNDIENISELFNHTTLRNVKGFYGTKKIKKAIGAFYGTTFINCDCKFADGFESLEDAQSMFKAASCQKCQFEYTIFNMPKLTNANEMFSGEKNLFPYGLEICQIKMPNLRSAVKMFSNIEDDIIDFYACKTVLPGCKNLSYTFFGCKRLEELNDVTIDAADMTGMFSMAEFFDKTAGYITAPNALNITEMFYGAKIEQFDGIYAPNATMAQMMYADTPIKVITNPIGLSSKLAANKMFDGTALSEIYGKNGEFLLAMLKAIEDRAK